MPENQCQEIHPVYQMQCRLHADHQGKAHECWTGLAYATWGMVVGTGTVA